MLPTFIQWYVVTSNLRLPLYTFRIQTSVSATTADDLYPYNQSGSVRVNRPFHQQRQKLIYLLSHAISVVWQRVQGEGASDKDSSLGLS